MNYSLFTGLNEMHDVSEDMTLLQKYIYWSSGLV